MGGMFSKPDTSAQEEALRQQEERAKREEARLTEEKAERAKKIQATQMAQARGGSRALMSEARTQSRLGAGTGTGSA